MKEVSNSEKAQRLLQTFQAMPWTNKEFYKNWLAQSFYYTTHSTRMLAFAAGWSPTTEQNYYRRSLAHIREEQSHDLLAVRDLEKLGSKRENYEELEVCRALWEPQFYKMQRSTKALLGYILALEYLAVQTFPTLNQVLTETYGKEATHFVRVHAEDDPDHVEEAFHQIAACSKEEQLEILKNFNQTCVMYTALLNDIKALS
jgi:uncharacterized ferritin-like protein (DUF455 family)